MFHTYGSPAHFMQGPETYPSDQVRSYYANAARGAAIVLCPTKVPSGSTGAPESGGGPQMMMPEGRGMEGMPEGQGMAGMPGMPEGEGGRGMMAPGGGDIDRDSFHMSKYDFSDRRVVNYLDQIIESVRSMGSLASGDEFDSDKDVVEQAKMVAAQGVDVMRISPSDFRDKDALRSTLEKIEAVKKATDLLLWTRFHVVHPTLPKESPEQRSDHFTVAEAINFLKMFEGYIDIAVFRLAGMMHSHPDGYCQEEGEPYILSCSQAIKESGVKVILAPNGGFQNLDENEAAIANGKCDMITMSRTWHVDYEYAQKAYEGRGEDVVPCVLCNRCHGSTGGPWYARCTANPVLGIESAVKVFKAPAAQKKVAVIGGGPAGMKAAITVAERGHMVTLYEKNAVLGGLLLNTDHDSFRWPYKRFKNYLVRQVEKAGIEVLLKTEATPAMIRAKGYDAVLVAAGAEPILPKIPGADGKNVWNVVDVYGREKELGKNVVVVGAGKYGTQTGVFLAKAGHNVTVLSSGRQLVQISGPHQDNSIVFAYQNLKNFTPITEAVTTRISDGKVTYKDASGSEKTIRADSVVIYAGLRPMREEALQFYGSAGHAFYIAGDCTGRCGDVQKSIRSGFLMGSQI
jgi:thioredoxin reductase/2,4-dienoyl-CoA reductase-like NADH-dependent reductase (Old Yellow Enzyme family)